MRCLFIFSISCLEREHENPFELSLSLVGWVVMHVAY